MLRNESLAVGVNVDVAVRLFIVPFMRGARNPPPLQTSAVNQIWRAIQPVDVWWWLSRSSFNHQFEKENTICSRGKKKKRFVLVRRTKATFFLFYPSVSVYFIFRGAPQQIIRNYRHQRGQSELNRQWTLAFVSSKITRCSRSWSVVFVFIVST